DSSFTFNVPDWDPKVDYHRDGGAATLSISQPARTTGFSNVTNRWDLKFNDAVPIAMTAHIGAGESQLALGSLNLRSLDVTVGAGETTIDLSGMPKRSYDAKVNASVGEAHIKVPKTVGVVVTAGNTIGGVSVDGLVKQGDMWVNAGHEQDAVVIHLDVKGGVGEIHVDAE
ncbi:MAG TPA: toast rack family protein, partial [Vicinamibacterales bacterium]|nr:toast rack family protein [Vicinamibacterales bacterium]